RTPRVMEELRRLLRMHPQDMTLGSAAQTLGVSARTLQRQLKEAAASFRCELHAARVDRAMDLLRTTDHKLMAIASAVGFRDPHPLTSLFQRLPGETPQSFRKRCRAADQTPVW